LVSLAQISKKRTVTGKGKRVQLKKSEKASEKERGGRGPLQVPNLKKAALSKRGEKAD